MTAMVNPDPAAEYEGPEYVGDENIDEEMAERDARQAVLQVAQARTDYATAKTAVDASLTRWREENAELLELEAATKAAMAEAEEQARTCAVGFYRLCPASKTPVPGIGIRVSRVIRFGYDDGEAFAWAKEHDVALALDRGAFEQLCGTASRPAFVEVTEEEKIAATIARDLAAAVAALSLPAPDVAAEAVGDNPFEGE
jgi:hypothetical protein